VVSVAGQTTSGNVVNVAAASAAFNGISWLQIATFGSPSLAIADRGTCALRLAAVSALTITGSVGAGISTGVCGLRIDGTSAQAQFGGFGSASALSIDGTYLVLWDTLRYMRKVLISTGQVSTVGGTGVFATAVVDGPLSSCSLGNVNGMSMHPGGQYMLFSDSGGSYCVIRNLTLSTMQVTTVAGNSGVTDVDGVGTSASFASIMSLAIHPSGNLVVIATSSSNIRLLNLTTMQITHLAGSWVGGISTDGVGLYAVFNNVTAVAFDSKGTYVVASEAYRVRKLVLRTANVTTIAGQSTSGTTDGTGTAVGFQATPLALVVAGSTCTAVTDCTMGYYSKVAGQPNSSNCVPCTVCAANQYTSQYCTTVSDTVCVNCSAGTVPYGGGPS
jgi:WD40 repeat protein